MIVKSPGHHNHEHESLIRMRKIQSNPRKALKHPNLLQIDRLVETEGRSLAVAALQENLHQVDIDLRIEAPKRRVRIEADLEQAFTP